MSLGFRVKAQLKIKTWEHWNTEALEARELAENHREWRQP